MAELTAQEAFAALQAAIKKSNELGIAEDIAIVDTGANLKAFIRMDRAWLGSVDIAIKKARTAAFFEMPTGEMGKQSQPGQPLYGIEESNGGLISFGGGVPIKNAQGEIVGGIGCSGSTVEHDEAVAQAALGTFGG